MAQREMTDVREQCSEITKEASAAKTLTAKVSNKMLHTAKESFQGYMCPNFFTFIA